MIDLKEVNILKICFAASSGGHLEQLMMLHPLMDKYNSFILTETTKYSTNFKNIKNYSVPQINRREILFFLKFLYLMAITMYIFLKERPDAVICTGALATIPICLYSKIFKKKLIYIESFSKINSPTLTGRIIYKFADQFFVQWEEMKKVYPRAIFKGGIY